jgi:hypothetical protein
VKAREAPESDDPGRATRLHHPVGMKSRGEKLAAPPVRPLG